MSSEIVLFKKQAPAIPKHLLAKEKLSLREEAWVWNDVLGAVIGLILLFVGITYLALPLTMAWLGILTVILGGGLAIERSVECLLRISSSGRSPLGNGFGRRKRLTHAGRRELVLIDHNRQKRPHRGAYKYGTNQYSVWPTFQDNGDGKEMTLLLLEHQPGPPWQPYWDAQVATKDYRVAMVQLGPKPDPVELREQQEKIEEAAAAMEKIPHDEQMAEYDNRATVLDIRR